MRRHDAGPAHPGELDRGGRSGAGGSGSSGDQREEAAPPLETLTLTEEYRTSREGQPFWTGRWTIHTGNGVAWAKHLVWRDALREVAALAEWLEVVRPVIALGDPRYGGPAPTV